MTNTPDDYYAFPPPGAASRRLRSRPDRLAAQITALQDLRGEYEHWLDALPDALAESDLADKLTDTIEQLETAADILAGIDLPRGFGRD